MDLKELSDEELDQLRTEVQIEQERRKALEQIPEQIRELTAKYVAGGGQVEDLQPDPAVTE